ncbi:TPA: glutamate--tRNA ligase [Candidatus Dependentiae bacterium]|nr:MAG: Glutamate-tRNA ligase [candidate division TM6 bacterium GW2011_GWF2_33_332]HBS48116.1 glutamate--tRNA ligase [Candidatus Dependentiae bacterium]HBZ73540.1 glutamate--tRNA ligase [Candidatus Dependentiae bacterium]
MVSSDIRVRFAPSPTGNLHVGGARVAIFNYLFAKNLGGKYLLRIEDTDVARSKKEYVTSILDSLKWLGLESDEPIVYQLSRIEDHKKAVQYLLDKGLAYPCFCEPQSYEDKMESGHTSGRYEGTCRDKKYTAEDLKKPHAIRLKAPQGEGFIKFHDLVRGDISFDYNQIDDFVLIRRDGIPTYNFVVVIDDIFMKISHVIRGEDHISNTPKQILLYEALGAKIPQFAHLPMILGASGKPLSKRDAATSVTDYRDAGIMPEALFNFLVRLGWAHGDQEVFTKEEMIKYFTLEKVGKKGAVFDLKKLSWISGVYIRATSEQELLAQYENFEGNYQQQIKQLWTDEQLKSLLFLHKERATNLVEIATAIIELASDPKSLDLSLISKWLTSDSAKLIETFIEKSEKDSTFDHHSLLSLANEICNLLNVKLVNLAQPLRLAIVGKVQSPGIFELMAILGKDRSIKRIKFLWQQILNLKIVEN